MKLTGKLFLFVIGCVVAVSVPAQQNISLLGHLSYGNVSCSNLTGYADTAGHEYALVGTAQGLSIVDIDTPANPHQLFLVPGATGQGGFWREVREYKGYAYVTTEEASGLVIVNLNYLPDSIQYHTINPLGMSTSHTIFIDENGIAYINGTDHDQIFLDLNADPYNPPTLGTYSLRYVHDCYVRNDTMWLAHINDGIVSVVDVTDKTDANNPAKTLATFSTPLNFSHNTWLSDDSRYLFTTDEKPASFLSCYDVSNLNNITETDRTQVNPGSNTIIHNTYFLNNYCITSYYTYGITIHDVLRKNNLVEVGSFDCSTNFSGDGFNGAWGVWPYLPSGNIIISDIETGLWIVKPTYERAAYLEGVIRDTTCNTFVNGVKIEIVEDSVTDFTNYIGRYSMGTADSGTYTIRFSKQGYLTVDTPGIVLKNGFLTTIDIVMQPVSTSNLVIKTLDSAGNNLPFIRVLILDSINQTVFDVSTDVNAEINYCDFVQGNYTFYAGRWGKITARVQKSITTSVDTVFFYIKNGYYDDFIMDYGWTTSSTASSGKWEDGEPDGTTYMGTESNPDDDIATDFGVNAYVTGNDGGAAGTDDLDDGITVLRSPLFNLTTYTNPYISYYAWFFNNGGSGSAPNDSLAVFLSNGFDTVLIDKLKKDSVQSQWLFRKIRVLDHTTLGVNSRIFFQAADANPGHLVEAAVDVFMVVDSPAAIPNAVLEEQRDVLFRAFPNPFTNEVYLAITPSAIESEFEILNAMGEKVYFGKLPAGKSGMVIQQQLKAGVYFASLRQNGAVMKTLKLVRQ